MLFVAAGAGLYVAHAWDLRTPPPASFAAFNQPRLEALQPPPAPGHARPRILMLGNSRLKYATILPDDPEATDSPSLFAGLDVVRVTNNNGTIEDFRVLSERVLALKPDVLLIQLDVFFAERPVQGGRLNWLVGALSYEKWRLFGFGPWNPGRADQRELQYDKPCLGHDDFNARQRRERRVFVNAETPNAVFGRWFAGSADRHGILVVFVTIPARERTERVMAAEMTKLPAKLASLFADHPRIRVLEVLGAETIDDAHYCDAVHLNEAGRRIYSTRLAAALQNLTGAQR